MAKKNMLYMTQNMDDKTINKERTVHEEQDISAISGHYKIDLIGEHTIKEKGDFNIEGNEKESIKTKVNGEENIKMELIGEESITIEVNGEENIKMEVSEEESIKMKLNGEKIITLEVNGEKSIKMEMKVEENCEHDKLKVNDHLIPNKFNCSFCTYRTNKSFNFKSHFTRQHQARGTVKVSCVRPWCEAMV